VLVRFNKQDGKVYRDETRMKVEMPCKGKVLTGILQRRKYYRVQGTTVYCAPTLY
jgi:hypothetical protein